MQLERSTNVIHHDSPDPAAQVYIRSQKLQPWIDEACRLIPARFELASNIAVEKHSDPELADEWVTLRIAARGEMEQILDAYDAFTREIVGILPPEVGRKLRLAIGMA